MGWFSKEKTLQECEKLVEKLDNLKDLPDACVKYESVVNALKKKQDGLAWQGSPGRRATKNAQLVRRMTRTGGN